MKLTIFPLILLLMVASHCPAETACKLLNKATAAGIFNMNDDFAGQAVINESAPCNFHYHDERVEYSLVIEVRDQSVGNEMLGGATCNSGEKALRGIGNEAFLCEVTARWTATAQIRGRVRDQLFLITLTSHGKSEALMDRDTLRENVTLAAEQVAGNLF